MSKRYTRRELEKLLMHCTLISMEMVQANAKRLSELDIKEKEWKEKEPSEKVKEGRQLLAIMNTLNYIIAPSFGFIEQTFPLSKPFIDLCRKNYKVSVDNKIFPSKCECPGCTKE